MPEEVLIISIFAIMAGTIMTVTRMILGYRERTRHGSRTASSDASMTTSELERLIRSSVKDAVDPLSRRLDRIESRGAGQPARLPERNTLLDIEDHELDEFSPEEEPARRSRSRL